MMKSGKSAASIFELHGIPAMSQAFPLALQHVVAMIVGCVTPAIIVAGAAGLDGRDRVFLIQAALVVSAVSTLLQLFPFIKGPAGQTGGPEQGLTFQLGCGLPVDRKSVV